MRLNFKKIWLILLLPVLVSLVPVEALSALPPIDVRDPYIRRFLSLSVGYEVGQVETTDNQSGESTESQRFHQSYDLSLIGNVVDPRLFVYTAGITFTDSTSSGTFTPESRFDSLALSFQTILMRQLKFPLTFTYKRIMTKSDPEGGESTSDHYALHWLLKFSKLPVTTFVAERNVDYPEDGDPVVSSFYQVLMSKKIWNTDNHFSQTLGLSESSKSLTTIFSNHTHLSRYTDLHSGLHMSQHTTDTDTLSSESNTMGLSMSLSSKPSRYFQQSHGFTSYETESDLIESSGRFFNGHFSFTPFKRMLSNLNMGASEQATHMTVIDSLTLLPVETDMASESMDLTASSTYEVTPRLMWNAQGSYRNNLNENSGVEAEVTETETLGVNTGLQYGRDIGWAGFSAGYSLGYMQETVKPDGKGSMMTNDVSLGLGGINLMNLVSFSTSASYSRYDNLSGNTWSNSRSLSASISNRFWQKYASASFSYGNSFSESWRDEDNSEANNYSISISSNYFKRLPVGVTHSFAERTSFENNTTSTHTTMFASHGRPLFRGSLSLKATYGMHTLEDDLVNGDSDYTQMNFDAAYKRILLGRIGWVSALSASRFDDKANSRFAQRGQLTNSFGYQLRAWSLSLVHKYIVLQGDFQGDFAESEILFKASRSFGWYI